MIRICSRLPFLARIWLILALFFASIGSPRPVVHDHSLLDLTVKKSEQFLRHWQKLHAGEEDDTGVHCHWIVGSFPAGGDSPDDLLPTQQVQGTMLAGQGAILGSIQLGTVGCSIYCHAMALDESWQALDGSSKGVGRDIGPPWGMLVGLHDARYLAAPGTHLSYPLAIGPWGGGEGHSVSLGSLLSRFDC